MALQCSLGGGPLPCPVIAGVGEKSRTVCTVPCFPCVRDGSDGAHVQSFGRARVSSSTMRPVVIRSNSLVQRGVTEEAGIYCCSTSRLCAGPTLDYLFSQNPSLSPEGSFMLQMAPSTRRKSSGRRPRHRSCQVVALGADPRSGQGTQGTPPGKKGAKKFAPSKLGYHPLEDLPAHEKGKGLIPEGQLTPAEMARTIAEVHSEGILFASTVPDDDSVLGTDINYLVDHNGEFYLELNDDDEILRNLEGDPTCSVLIGFGTMDEVSLGDVVEEVDEDSDNDSNDGSGPDDDSDSEEVVVELTEEDLQFWGAMFPGGLGRLLESFTPEAMGTLGAWGGLETLQWIHPREFATRLADAATADNGREMDHPTKRITVTGVVRRATSEEETRIRELWDENYVEYDDRSDSDTEFGASFEDSAHEEGEEVEGYGEDEEDAEGSDRKGGSSAKGTAGRGGRADGASKGRGLLGGGVLSGVIRDGIWMGEPINMLANKRGASAKQAPLEELHSGPTAASAAAAAFPGGDVALGGTSGNEGVISPGKTLNGSVQGLGREESGMSPLGGDSESSRMDEPEPGPDSEGEGGDGGESTSPRSSEQSAEGSGANGDGDGDSGGAGDVARSSSGSGSRVETRLVITASGSQVTVSRRHGAEVVGMGGVSSFRVEGLDGAVFPGEAESSSDEEGIIEISVSADGSGDIIIYGEGGCIKVIEGTDDGVDGGTIIELSGGSGWGEEGEEEEEEEDEAEVGTSLYKLEILNIQLDSSSGLQESVDATAWGLARPDMLAQSASSIVERANSLERARSCMADLVLRETGTSVDEVFMVGIDHLGIDLRVRTGIELKTLRFPFRYPAINERFAEKLLDELLRPRAPQSRSNPKRNRQPKRVKGRFKRPT
eukprot:jgi/Mesen1/5783/ME000293S04938